MFCTISAPLDMLIESDALKTKQDRRDISSLLWEIGVAEQEYDVRFSAKYLQNSPKLQNSDFDN